MDQIQALFELLGPLKDLHFLLYFLVGFFCIIPPFGLISSLVINRAMKFGIRSTLPVILSATAGDAITCLVVVSGATYIINLVVSNGNAIAKVFLWVLLLYGIYRVMNHFRPSKSHRPTGHENWVAFLASIFNPINYVLFGATLLATNGDGVITLWDAVWFTFAILLGCLAAWFCTANYYRLLRSVFNHSEHFQGIFAWVLTLVMLITGAYGLLST